MIIGEEEVVVVAAVTRLNEVIGTSSSKRMGQQATARPTERDHHDDVRRATNRQQLRRPTRLNKPTAIDKIDKSEPQEVTGDQFLPEDVQIK